MNAPSTVIVGAEGQLGRALAARYPEAQALGRSQLDIGDSDAVSRFSWEGVRLVINAAAYTKVDLAETPDGQEAAWRANALGPANLALAAMRHENITLVHVSTDYVFDGTRQPHDEEEPLTPINVYGHSKAAGDLAVMGLAKHIVVRTGWVVGDGGNFVKAMLGLAAKDVSPKVVSDQIGRLTFTSTLVDAIDHLVTTEAAPGTYNVTNSGKEASWAAVARQVFWFIGRFDLHVDGITTAEYSEGKQVAPRPLLSTLSLDKLEATGFHPEDWRTALRDYLISLGADARKQTA
jgi:dTDP-4-dehydrorhamnose reductase